MNKKYYRICIDQEHNDLSHIDEDELLNDLYEEIQEMLRKIGELIDSVEDLITTRDILKF